MSVTQIIQGTINNFLDKNPELYQERIAICKQCPLLNSLGVCDPLLYLNPQTGEVSRSKKEGFVRGCSCVMSSKTRVPNAKCVAGKW